MLTGKLSRNIHDIFDNETIEFLQIAGIWHIEKTKPNWAVPAHSLSRKSRIKILQVFQFTSFVKYTKLYIGLRLRQAYGGRGVKP